MSLKRNSSWWIVAFYVILTAKSVITTRWECMDLSVTVPLYNERENVNPLYSAIVNAVTPLATERSPPLVPASWPRHANLPLTYHPVPNIA